VLGEAAISGKFDYLRGLKEKGDSRLIPAARGMEYYGAIPHPQVGRIQTRMPALTGPRPMRRRSQWNQARMRSSSSPNEPRSSV
jgi:hypothetical protein